MTWVPPTWTERKRAFVLGGGPSLAHLDLSTIDRNSAYVVALNCAWEVAPWADMLYFADRRWWDWNKDKLSHCPVPLIVSRSEIPWQVFDRPFVHKIGRSHDAISFESTKVAGADSGSNAINLLLNMGVEEIVLLGFDMRPGQWHDLHKAPQVVKHFTERFIPAHKRMAERFPLHCSVVNATPDSALKCWPMGHPADYGIRGKHDRD